MIRINESKRYARVAILFLMCISLWGGVFLQKYHIPGRILQSLIIHNQSEIRNYSEPVDHKLIAEFGKPAEIYHPNSPFIYSTEPEKSSMRGPGFFSYRYYWHYKEVADYLVSNDAKQIALKLHDAFWRVEADGISDFLEAMEPKRRFLKETLGVQDLPRSGEIKDSTIVFQNGSLIINKVKLEGRLKPISVPVYIAKPRNMRIKGVVIAIHGHSGAPEKVLGIEPRDYTRQFGGELAKRGYVVYAPYVLSVGNRNDNISALGMLYSENTNFSIDLQKLLAIVDHIKNDPELSGLPLATYGISYGGLLSLMLASIDKRVSIIISSGRMQSDQVFFEDFYAFSSAEGTRSYFVIFNKPYHIYFSYSDLAKLVYPRPLIIEYGALDDQPGSIREWEVIKGVYKRHNMTKNLKLVWFKGYHETAPQLTIPVLDQLVEAQNSG